MLTCGYPGHTHDTVAVCDAWHCDCGNEPYLDGFLTCTAEGEFTEDWPCFFLCGGCGKIYTPEGRETGRAVPLQDEGPTTTCWDCGVTVAVGDVYVSRLHAGKALCPECFERAEKVGRARVGQEAPPG